MEDLKKALSAILYCLPKHCLCHHTFIASMPWCRHLACPPLMLLAPGPSLSLAWRQVPLTRLHLGLTYSSGIDTAFYAHTRLRSRARGALFCRHGVAAHPPATRHRVYHSYKQRKLRLLTTFIIPLLIPSAAAASPLALPPLRADVTSNRVWTSASQEGRTLRQAMYSHDNCPISTIHYISSFRHAETSDCVFSPHAKVRGAKVRHHSPIVDGVAQRCCACTYLDLLARLPA